MLDAVCSSCAAKLRVRDEASGKNARCPKCGNVFVVAPPPDEPIVATLAPEPAPPPPVSPVALTAPIQAMPALPAQPMPLAAPVTDGYANPNKDFDFGDKPEASAATSGNDSHPIIESRRSRSRAAHWLGVAGNGYVILGLFYLFQAAVPLCDADFRNPAYLLGQIAGSAVGAVLAFVLGMYLKRTAWSARQFNRH